MGIGCRMTGVRYRTPPVNTRYSSGCTGPCADGMAPRTVSPRATLTPKEQHQARKTEWKRAYCTKSSYIKTNRAPVGPGV